MNKILSAMFVVIIFTLICVPCFTFATQENEGFEVTQTSNASKVTLENLSSKDEKIAYYTEKYGDKTEGIVAYYISIFQKYSIPVFFLLLIWGSFNCFIIGNKKLQKREQGFNMILVSIIGLVVFQVIPLIYAIFVAGR